ncbi:MAG TPA: 6-bladed beta-propeller, partial [Candidatus Saccharicenans sp.]|nr:6-bladed beta-propeller [Candidatus Saccharicenans sp.]
MKKSWVSGLLLVCLLLAFFLVSACSREEKIEIKEEDGVTVVYNPKKPVPLRGVPSTLSLKEELVLGKTGNEEAMLLNPRAVEADQTGNIYVLDDKAVQIKVYDPQGNFIRAIGRRGQGPGEFQSPRSFCLTPQLSLAVCDSLSRQVVIFGLDGQFIRALPDKTR